MLLNKIRRLKTKIRSTVNNLDLIDVIIEDSEELHRRLEDQNEEIDILKNKIQNLEVLNISYSNDIILLSKAVAEQYEIIKEFLTYKSFDDEFLWDSEDELKKKKKKIVH